MIAIDELVLVELRSAMPVIKFANPMFKEPYHRGFDEDEEAIYLDPQDFPSRDSDAETLMFTRA